MSNQINRVQRAPRLHATWVPVTRPDGRVRMEMRWSDTSSSARTTPRAA